MAAAVVFGTAGTCRASSPTFATVSLHLVLPGLSGLLGPCPLLHLVRLHPFPLHLVLLHYSQLPLGQPGLGPVGPLVVLMLVLGMFPVHAPVVRMVSVVGLVVVVAGFWVGFPVLRVDLPVLRVDLPVLRVDLPVLRVDLPVLRVAEARAAVPVQV